MERTVDGVHCCWPNQAYQQSTKKCVGKPNCVTGWDLIDGSRCRSPDERAADEEAKRKAEDEVNRREREAEAERRRQDDVERQKRAAADFARARAAKTTAAIDAAFQAEHQRWSAAREEWQQQREATGSLHDIGVGALVAATAPGLVMAVAFPFAANFSHEVQTSRAPDAKALEDKLNLIGGLYTTAIGAGVAAGVVSVAGVSVIIATIDPGDFPEPEPKRDAVEKKYLAAHPD